MFLIYFLSHEEQTEFFFLTEEIANEEKIYQDLYVSAMVIL